MCWIITFGQNLLARYFIAGQVKLWNPRFQVVGLLLWASIQFFEIYTYLDPAEPVESVEPVELLEHMEPGVPSYFVDHVWTR